MWWNKPVEKMSRAELELHAVYELVQDIERELRGIKDETNDLYTKMVVIAQKERENGDLNMDETRRGEQCLVGIKGEPGPNGSMPRVYATGLGGGPGGCYEPPQENDRMQRLIGDPNWRNPPGGCPRGPLGPRGSKDEPELINHLLTAIGRCLQGDSHSDSDGNRRFTGLDYFEMIQIEDVLENYRRLLTEPLYRQINKGW